MGGNLEKNLCATQRGTRPLETSLQGTEVLRRFLRATVLMVVDALLRKLNDEGFYFQGYADDFVILLRGTHLDTLMGFTR